VVSSTPRPRFTPGKNTLPILQEAEWAPWPVWTSGKYRPHRDSIPYRPARSQSLYRLSYPDHIIHILSHLNESRIASEVKNFPLTLHDGLLLFMHTYKQNFLSVQSKLTLLISANIYELECCCMRKSASNFSKVLSFHIAPNEHSRSTVISPFLYI